MLRYRYALTRGVICFVVFCCDLTIQKAYALAGSTAHDGSNAQAVHALGETGEDVNVGLITARNVLATHEAFYDKDINGNPIGATHVFNYDFSGSGIVSASHDTWMAGIVASRGGVSHPYDIGVAPGAYLHCARVANDSNEIYFSWLNNALNELIIGRSCKVIVTGISFTATTSDGQSITTLLYDYYAYHYNVTFANAAGNEDTRIAVLGDTYNGITTGGLRVTYDDNYGQVGNLSGSGPTYDGRGKPDIVAPSQNQTMPSAGSDTSWYEWTSDGGHTSLSAPHTAGVAALLLGLADNTPDPCYNQNEVIRAVIVNSTFPNIDDKSGSQTDPAIWNEDRGYGRIDALRAYQLLDSNCVFPDVTITEEKGWAFDAIAPSQQHTYTIYAPRRYRLVATLTWDRRVEWTDTFHPYLANLDLRIYKPNNLNPIFNKQIGGFSTNDNLIKADFLLPRSGQYTLKVVNNSNNETAHYGLAFELLPPIPGDFNLDYIVNSNDLFDIAENWLQPVPGFDTGFNFFDFGALAFFSENWLQSAAGSNMDLCKDDFVDFRDFAIFAKNWLQPAPGSDTDLFKDGFIDFRDFALLAENWLITDPAYYQD